MCSTRGANLRSGLEGTCLINVGHSHVRHSQGQSDGDGLSDTRPATGNYCCLARENRTIPRLLQRSFANPLSVNVPMPQTAVVLQMQGGLGRDRLNCPSPSLMRHTSLVSCYGSRGTLSIRLRRHSSPEVCAIDKHPHEEEEPPSDHFRYDHRIQADAAYQPIDPKRSDIADTAMVKKQSATILALGISQALYEGAQASTWYDLRDPTPDSAHHCSHGDDLNNTDTLAQRHNIPLSFRCVRMECQTCQYHFTGAQPRHVSHDSALPANLTASLPILEHAEHVLVRRAPSLPLVQQTRLPTDSPST